MQGTDTMAQPPHAGPDALRVGCAEARPWSYRARHAPPALEMAAIAYVAARLGRPCVHHGVAADDLAGGLLRGDYDIAIGGLSPEPCAGLRAVRLPHPRVWSGHAMSGPRIETRHALFPDVWWMRADDVRLRWRVRLALLRWRLAMSAVDASVLAATRMP
jgi:hypothetical protein